MHARALILTAKRKGYVVQSVSKKRACVIVVRSVLL